MRSVEGAALLKRACQPAGDRRSVGAGDLTRGHTIHNSEAANWQIVSGGMTYGGAVFVGEAARQLPEGEESAAANPLALVQGARRCARPCSGVDSGAFEVKLRPGPARARLVCPRPEVGCGRSKTGIQVCKALL